MVSVILKIISPLQTEITNKKKKEKRKTPKLAEPLSIIKIEL